MNEEERLEAWQVVLRRDMTSIEEFVEALEVETKDGTVVPFNLKGPQRRLVRAMQEAWDKGHAFYCLVLKARQIGMSTLVQALQAEGLLRWPGMHAMTVSYEVEQAEELSTKVDFFISQVPEAVRPDQRLASRRQNAIRHYDENGQFQESRLSVKTAENTKAGRGYTLHRVHLSEPTFYRNKKALLGLKNAVPNKPGCFVILEFTGNGMEEIKALWDAAQRGENDYFCLFVSWLDEPDYQIMLEPGESLTIEKTLDQHEKMLRSRGATYEQIKWWRWCLRNLCDGHLPSAKQEYPSTPTEAFQSTGRPVFNVPFLDSWLKTAEEEWRLAKRGHLIDNGAQILFIDGTQHGDEGFWTVYEAPLEGEFYVWGADTATGKSADEDGKGEGDASCSTVLNARTRRRAAVFHGRPDVDVYTEETRKAAKWYGLAWGHAESNGVGQAFLTAAKMLGFKTILYRTRLEPTAGGDPSPEIRPGFATTPKTKEAIVMRLATVVRQLGMRDEWKPPTKKDKRGEDVVIEGARPVCPLDFPLMLEMLVFQRDAMGRMGAVEGKHDDRVMSRCLAEQAVEDAQDVGRTAAKSAEDALAEAWAKVNADAAADEEHMEAEEHAAAVNTEIRDLWRSQPWATN